MPYKHCDKCHEYSYSASSRGQWICPHCGLDITDAEVCYEKPNLPESKRSA